MAVARDPPPIRLPGSWDRNATHDELLDEVVDSLSFKPIMHLQVRFGPHFSVRVDSRSRAPGYLAQGQPFRLRYPAARWEAEIAPGDVVLLPRGGDHTIYNDAGVPPMAFRDVASRLAVRQSRHSYLAVTGAPHQSTLFSSFFWSRELAAHPLMAALPPVLHLRPSDPAAAGWLPAMGGLLSGLGTAGIGADELANVMIRHVVHTHLRQRAAAAVPQPGGPQDAQLLPALHAIHGDPASPWSVAALADKCSLSRTAFAVRFAAATGETPMRYLARWRIHLADRLLAGQKLSLDQLAERVGYANGVALSKAYKRITGHAPAHRPD
jgi:AraC-like DNA-binding protein